MSKKNKFERSLMVAKGYFDRGEKGAGVAYLKKAMRQAEAPDYFDLFEILEMTVRLELDSGIVWGDSAQNVANFIWNKAMEENDEDWDAEYFSWRAYYIRSKAVAKNPWEFTADELKEMAVKLGEWQAYLSGKGLIRDETECALVISALNFAIEAMAGISHDVTLTNYLRLADVAVERALQAESEANEFCDSLGVLDDLSGEWLYGEFGSPTVMVQDAYTGEWMEVSAEEFEADIDEQYDLLYEDFEKAENLAIIAKINYALAAWVVGLKFLAGREAELLLEGFDFIEKGFDPETEELLLAIALGEDDIVESLAEFPLVP